MLLALATTAHTPARTDDAAAAATSVPLAAPPPPHPCSLKSRATCESAGLLDNCRYYCLVCPHVCMRRARSAGVEFLLCLSPRLARRVILAEDGQQPLPQDLVASGDGRALHHEVLLHPSPQSAYTYGSE